VTQIDHGVLTAVTMPGATLIPNAFGLAGFNQHTWTSTVRTQRGRALLFTLGRRGLKCRTSPLAIGDGHRARDPLGAVQH
jgi:hypothetical protein